MDLLGQIKSSPFSLFISLKTSFHFKTKNYMKLVNGKTEQKIVELLKSKSFQISDD